MTQPRKERFVDRIRYHDPREIEPLLDWCQTNARQKPRNVVAVGLAYVEGLNEHQIAAATVVERGAPVRIEFPNARRRAAIAAAERVPLEIHEPAWLAAAAEALIAQTEGLKNGDYLYRAKRRFNLPQRPDLIRALVAEAAKEACGTHLSCASLNQSRVAALREEGLTLALFGSGHAHSWAARLAAAELQLQLPRRTT